MNWLAEVLVRYWMLLLTSTSKVKGKGKGKDAAVIFSRLVQRSGHYGSDNCDKESSMRFYRDVCDKLKKFNSELFRLAQDRKFRNSGFE